MRSFGKLASVFYALSAVFTLRPRTVVSAKIFLVVGHDYGTGFDVSLSS